MNRRRLIAGLVSGAGLLRPSLASAQGLFETSAVVSPARLNRPRHDHPFPGARMARGTRAIQAAWFSDATQRYRHFMLGQDAEPAALVVSVAGRRALKLVLPDDSVFEDREPRIVDIDGVDMIIAVRSYLKRGAALALIAIVNNELKIVAETPPIGAPFKWLNPIGPADFASDGILQIALVRTPHIDGQLQLWTARSGSLVQTFAVDDVSNHVVRSPFMNLHAIGDFNGDGTPDLAVPSQDRRRLRFFTFRGGRAREFAQAELPAPATEDFKVVRQDGAAAVLVGLSGGRTFLVKP